MFVYLFVCLAWFGAIPSFIWTMNHVLIQNHVVLGTDSAPLHAEYVLQLNELGYNW